MLYLFTFHYVSIKTRIEVYSRCFFYNLHSTMYLLKRYTIYWQFANDTNLHSTMYLLKQEELHAEHYMRYNLHSTMYLLKLLASLKRNAILLFTFHYVSIKTKHGDSDYSLELYLHSTMYLLKQVSFLCALSNV